MTRSAHRWFVLSLCLALLPAVTACQWIDRRNAEGVAERFVQAAVAGDFAALRETTDPDNGYDNAKYLIAREFGAFDFKRRLEGLALKTVQIDEARATVHAVGTVRYRMPYPVPFMATTAPIEWAIELVKKDGLWYVHEVDDL